MTETRTRNKPIAELEDFKLWLASLEGRPLLHVNGPSYAIAVLTVDFGVPLEEQKLAPELTGELINRMRMVTKVLCKEKESNVRVQTDTGNGIYWSSIG